MRVNTEIWGEPENAYTGFNQRGSTSDINDPDFTDFPPISLCAYTDAASYRHLLYQWINGGKLSLDDEIDKSICYVGMFNSDLPQLNIVGLYNNTKNTLDDPLYKTDNTQIQSFIFTSITNYNEFADRLDWGASQLYTDTYITHDYRLRRYKGGIIGTAPNVSPQGNANCNSFLNVIQNFGIKCFILEINVKYKTGTDSNDVTTGTYTLKEYVEQTTAWKAEHPIVTAYCRPFWRSNKNGTYSYTKPSGYFCELMPVFTLPYKSNANDITDNISYHTNVCRTTATRTGYFPIYGAIIQELKTSASAVAIQEQGRAALLIGANRGILNSITSGGSKRYWLELDGTNDGNIEYIRRGAAAYGMFFCDDIGNLATSGGDVLRWIDDEMCLGIVDENGLTDGDYSHGIQNALQRNFAWSTINDSDYDPSRPPVPQNDYDTTTIFNSIGDTATMFKRYVINDVNVKQLGRDLFKITNDLATSVPKYDDYATQINASMLVTNPLDSIVSLQRFPMAIPRDSENSENIKLGTNDCNAIGYPMSKSCYEYAFEGKTIQPKFGDSFLDYEPYTTFEMYIPFCGTVHLSPRDILNRQLSARLVVDFSTGSCTGYVLSDNLVIETVNGNLAIDIPVTGTDSATMRSNINNAVATHMSARTNREVSMLTPFTPSGLTSAITNPFKAAGNLRQSKTDLDNATYNLSHIQAPVHTIGAATPCGAWAIDLKCRLIIYYPTGDVIRKVSGLPEWNDLKLAVYGQTVGFATCEPSTISGYTGLVVAANPELNNVTTANGNPATSDELTMISQALANGVINNV